MKVIDASLATKLVLSEEGSDETEELWRGWSASGELPVAPPLFTVETASALRRRVYRGLLTTEEGLSVFRSLRRLVVRVLEPPGLYDRAWELAEQFERPNAYDACYLALADLTGSEFWTADAKLVNAVGDRFPLIRHLGAAAP